MADDEPGYRKIGNRVLLRGKISGGTDQLAFTLPEGFPSERSQTNPSTPSRPSRSSSRTSPSARPTADFKDPESEELENREPGDFTQEEPSTRPS